MGKSRLRSISLLGNHIREFGSFQFLHSHIIMMDITLNKFLPASPSTTCICSFWAASLIQRNSCLKVILENLFSYYFVHTPKDLFLDCSRLMIAWVEYFFFSRARTSLSPHLALNQYVSVTINPLLITTVSIAPFISVLHTLHRLLHSCY